jgi:serine/threonine protein kinase
MINYVEEIVRSPILLPIEEDKRLYNLASGYWVYDELLSNLRSSGWIRIASGFKSGLYGHPSELYCIKILGMGVGENPLYFCERGYYLEHERNMLADFRDAGFNFAPEVLTKEESIKFLIEKCGVCDDQAKLRVVNNDLLIMEYISGIPFATQIGRYLNYDVNIVLFDDNVLREICDALEALCTQLMNANSKKLLHNDPMPPNIIFTLDKSSKIEARLVDFELAQNLCKQSPDYVNNSVAELYRERDVPRNTHTGTYTKNLDRHLMDESIKLAKEIRSTAKEIRSLGSILDAISIGIPFIGGIEINLGQIFRSLKRRS